MKLNRYLILLLALLILLPAGARSTIDSIKEFEAQEGTGWTFRRLGGEKVLSMYGPGTKRKVFDESDAQSFLRDYAEMFGIEDLSLLRLENLEKSDSGTSFYYRQYVHEIPVAGGELALHADKHGSVVAVGGRYHSMAKLSGGSLQLESSARKNVARMRYADGAVSNGTLVIVPGVTNARLAWKFSALSQKVPGQWGIYVDALNPQKVLRIHREFADLNGTGTVFSENPVVTPTLTSEQFRYLRDTHNLSGKYVKTYNANFQLPFRRNGPLDEYTTASELDDDYTYVTSDAKFSEAMAYYHINVVHDRWRSFGFRKLNLQFPVFVNIVTASGTGFDNAFYTRGGFPPFPNGAIVMGSGNRLENLGHDADVYYHEYGHAVLDRAKPGFLEAIEANYSFAFHEGFGDISAAAITGNSKLAEFGLRLKSGRFIGRNLQNNNRFPQNVILPGWGKSESHHTGLIAGGTWWDLQKEIGRDKAQSILYNSLAILPNDMNFFDLRDAMLTADLRKNGGVNSTSIQNAFAKHGLGGSDPGQPGSVQIRSLKTARLNLSNFNLTIRSTFKRGDIIVVVANYSGSALTPGYNLISDIQLTGPPNANVDAFGFIDEVANGLHLGKRGVWVGEIGTYSFSQLGTYTVTFQGRLGGTTQITPTKTVKFRLTQ